MSSPKKAVIATAVETGDVTVYPSVVEAAAAFGVKDDHIRRVLRGERKTCCGRRWEFLENEK